MPILKMTDINLENRFVLIREDLNVPIKDGKITSDIRIRAALPTIEYCLRKNARVIIMSHLGRPTEGKYEEAYSLKLVADHLSHLLGQPIHFAREWPEGLEAEPGEVVLLENVRFNVGEKENDPILAKKMANLCDVFVMDAFATAHRSEASTCGVAQFVPIACAGPLLLGELGALKKVMDNPARPLIAIVGGSKVSSKLLVLESLLKKVDRLIVGGGIANAFIAASGHSIGKSLYEAQLIPEAQRLIELAKKQGTAIPIPTDVVVAKIFSQDAQPFIKKIGELSEDDIILDIGPETASHLAAQLTDAGTILWNGPVGVFEWDAFGEGTKALANAIAESNAFTVAGGGDTLAAIDKYHMSDRLSYISTGGGAFLEFIEGKTLPAIAALENQIKDAI